MMESGQNISLNEDRSSYPDIGLASVLVMLWLATLVGGFIIPLDQGSFFLIVFGIFIRTFLHTGLFVVAHESIHQNISGQRALNEFFGHLTSCLYALLAYDALAKNHRLHHRYPETHKDPDFAYPGKNNYLFWYFRFMRNYQAEGQALVSLIGMAVIFCALISFHISILNLLSFWIIPMIASSFQLFTFGIFLPHRHGNGRSLSQRQVSSTNLPVFLSFITCYHLGYHREHHRYPYLPWYRLPNVYLEDNRA